ncbi:hypothetical protein SETIT_8G188400v2 [Setaria italica]|uniref:Uncharacterized protein n=1 Tax=Setaria italica TaxID=4555 RepID=A0A368S999_SETIT|nr:hypothetical protein SETIT_8G188400v2 [Setaria italica]
MKITVHTSKSIKPAYVSGSANHAPAATTSDVVPLTVFDEVNHDMYIPGILAFHPPAPSVAVLEAGLAKVLAKNREWAGRLVMDTGSKRVILLNDAGARLAEVSADVALDVVLPLRVGPEALQLHPSCDGAEDLLLVQVTRFPCGPFTVGYNIHHYVSDSYATCTCLMAWGMAVRGVALDPAMVHDRASLFVPRDPPLVEFEHRGIEFKPRVEKKAFDNNDGADDDVVVETMHFSQEFISQLKSRASAGERRPYSTVQRVVAHLWRGIHRQRRALGSAEHHRAGADGHSPASHGRALISQAVFHVDDRYFRSFIDFACSGAVEREGLVRTTVLSELVMRTNIEIDSVLGIPFYDLDLGSGNPFLYVPSTPQPVEGAIYLMSSFSGDGGVVAYVSLFRHAVDRNR